MSFSLSTYTTSCNPVLPDVVSNDFDEIKAEALERLEWIKERAFGADDTVELEAHEDLGKYAEVETLIKAVTADDPHLQSEPGVEKKLIFGPLPCGYNIEIEAIAP